MTFDIDANGILNVKAKDKASGKEQSITITASSGLSKDEVERMKQDAALHADEDKKKRELIDVRNGADSLVFTAEKAVKDAGDKIPADVKKEVEEKIEAVKKVKDGEDKDAIKKATDDLGQTIQKIGQAMYGSTGSPQGKGSESASQQDGKSAGGEAGGGEVRPARRRPPLAGTSRWMRSMKK